MSLDEAKQVTTAFSETFVPPPRTIRDIKALLEPTAHRRVFQFPADMTFPPLPNPEAPEYIADLERRVDLGDLYHRRGLVLRRLGRFAEARKYLMQASKLITTEMRVRRRWNANWGSLILRDLGETEASSGDYWRARGTFEAALSAALGVGLQGAPFEIRARLVELYALTGDLRAADRMLTVLVNTHHQSRNWTWPVPEQRAEIEATVARAKADLLELRGRFAEAEHFRRAQ